jgi:hypothetical protein
MTPYKEPRGARSVLRQGKMAPCNECGGARTISVPRIRGVLNDNLKNSFSGLLLENLTHSITKLPLELFFCRMFFFPNGFISTGEVAPIIENPSPAKMTLIFTYIKG